MRKKIEKIFWDMEIIGNRRKISLKKSQICLLLQQKCNKTVQVQVTIIPRQRGKELYVLESLVEKRIRRLVPPVLR